MIDTVLEMNRSQAEHALKHDLGGKYQFNLTHYSDESRKYEPLEREDLEEDFSLPDTFENIRAEFYGDNRQSRVVQFEKLIEYIK